MNKIFKVIWSKSKQCYIVVSEIAKNKTGKKKIVVAGIFAALAMTSMSTDIYAFNGIGATNKYDSSAAGAKYVQGQGLVLGTTGSEVSGDSNTVAIGSDSHSFGSASVAIGGGHTTKKIKEMDKLQLDILLLVVVGQLLLVVQVAHQQLEILLLLWAEDLLLQVTMRLQGLVAQLLVKVLLLLVLVQLQVAVAG